ncbi:MAG TPA: hypothetical protein VGM86_16070 [Thermoanaerobaculia bacterium]
MRLAALGLAVATVLSLAAPAFAGETPAATKGPDTGNGAVAASDAPGKLRQPTAAERKALAAGIESLLKRSPSSLRVKQTADGTMSVDLGTSFLNITVAVVGPDGTIRQVCVSNAAAAEAFATAPLSEDK